jgi:hypothetical protein
MVDPGVRLLSKYWIMVRDGFRCFYCNKPSHGSEIPFGIDHLIPIVGGGENVNDNLVTCCKACNCQKSDIPLPDDVLKELQEVIRERNKQIYKHKQANKIHWTEKKGVTSRYNNKMPANLDVLTTNNHI